MLRNYLRVAYRGIARHPVYTLTNVLGLAIGIGSCLFLLLLDQYAFDFDAYHQKADRIFRLTDEVVTQSGSKVHAAITPMPWGPKLAEVYPEVEAAVRFRGVSHGIRHGDQWFNQTIQYVDPSIFDVFTYPLASGDPHTALAQPYSIVLSQAMARKYFGDTDALGQTLTIDGKTPYTVTGVLKKLPDNSSFFFDFLAPYSTLVQDAYPGLDDWTGHRIYTYLLLAQGADAGALEGRLNQFIATYVDEEAASRYEPHLQPLESIYLHSQLFAEQGNTMDIAYVYIFSAIAFFVLLVACVNFMNMATARAANRAREVGMRKVLGAYRRQLVGQFLAEALLVTVLATALALLLVQLTLPLFNSMTAWSVAVHYGTNTFFDVSVVGIVLIVTLMAGAYPAFYLSAYRPVRVLKGALTRGHRGARLRKLLVVSQFAVAVFLIVSAMIVDDQITFLKDQPLGFDAQDVLIVNAPTGTGFAQRESLRQELLMMPGIRAAALASSTPEGSYDLQQFRPEGTYEKGGLLVPVFSIDPYYLQTLDIGLVAGRTFRPGSAADTTSSYIINETAARRFGWKDPIGKRIYLGTEGDEVGGTVIGVVEDFHITSLQEAIEPLIMQMRPGRTGLFVLRTESPDTQALLASLRARWEQYDTARPMTYYFLQDDWADEYETEEIIQTMLADFTYLTILLACLGLLGLASYTTIQRTREIGIRKAMGASSRGIVVLLSKDFVKLVLFSVVVAAPLGYFAMRAWLANFAYQTSIHWYVFALAGTGAVLLAFGTIAYRAIRAALTDPVEALRYE